MAVHADIIVSGAYDADWELVVEVKRVDRISTAVVDRLRRYLQASNCPLGLLITTTELRIYRETFRDPGLDSVKLVAAHPLPDELKREAVSGELFERSVQRWLERLADFGVAFVQDAALAASLTEHILPVLRGGTIRAGGPRWERTAAG